MGVPSVNILEVLRPEHVAVTVAGHRFTLNATKASDWIGAVAFDVEELAGIMPGLIQDEDLDVMWSLCDTCPDLPQRWIHAARTALGRAGGRDWWWTRNVCKQALGTWPYTNGMLLRQGVNSGLLGFPDWLDACYTLWWEKASEQDRIKLDMTLNMKPPGVAVRQSKAQMQEMVSAFNAD